MFFRNITKNFQLKCLQPRVQYLSACTWEYIYCQNIYWKRISKSGQEQLCLTELKWVFHDNIELHKIRFLKKVCNILCQHIGTLHWFLIQQYKWTYICFYEIFLKVHSFEYCFYLFFIVCFDDWWTTKHWKFLPDTFIWMVSLVITWKNRMFTQDIWYTI